VSLSHDYILECNSVDQSQQIVPISSCCLGTEPNTLWHRRSASHFDEIFRVERTVQPVPKPHEISIVASPLAAIVGSFKRIRWGFREEPI
jgi:hypothetical protein